MKSSQPKAPLVSPKTWQKLYEAAYAFLDLSPTVLLEQDDLFVIQNPFTGQIGYCLLEGEEEGPLSFILYRGREALEFYHRIKKGEILPDDPEFFCLHDMLMFDVKQGEEVAHEEDVKVFQALCLPPNRSTLLFRSYLPGFQGWHLNEEEAVFLTLALECAVLYGKNKEKPLFKEENEYPIYLPKWEEDVLTWEIKSHTPAPLPVKTFSPLPIDPARLAKLKGVKLYRDAAWELSIFYTTNVILESERPYFARVLMIVHQESLLVLQVKPLQAQDSSPVFLAETFLSSIELHKRIPAEIFLNSEELYEAITPLARALGIQSNLVPFLPATAPARESLVQYMNKS